MYFVYFKSGFGYNLCKFHTLDAARSFVKELAEKGVREFYLSQELPVGLKIEVQI